MSTRLADFDFDLPPERIARNPVHPRDQSRLLVLERDTGRRHDSVFTELCRWLSPGDLLVVNTTQVIPARLQVHKPTGGAVELLFIEPVEGGVELARRWRVMGRPGKALQPEVVLQGPGGLRLRVVKREGLTALVEAEVPLWSIMERHGEMPLPPYIDREATVDDRQDYQTLFARERGAVAAPTASLHFTKRVLALLQERRVARAELVLHVGPGTFLPVRPEHADDVRQHVMHSERYEIPEATLEAIAETRKRGGRVVAVGTTVARTLEAWGKGAPAAGTTDIFITPGFEFTQVDALVTNFHLPKSTLLMLVSAFAGLELVREAYRHAIEAKYRFYSYGDAMLIV